MHLTAMYIVRASIKIGTIVRKTMGAGAQEPLLTPFIEFVEDSFTLNCNVKLLSECYKVERVLILLLRRVRSC